MSLESLPLNATHTRYACGIYRLGDEELNYIEVFVTDSGRVLPLTGRMVRGEDLMDVYAWGRQDAVSDYGLKESAVAADGGLSVTRARKTPRVYEPEEDTEYPIGPAPSETQDSPLPTKEGSK